MKERIQGLSAVVIGLALSTLLAFQAWQVLLLIDVKDNLTKTTSRVDALAVDVPELKVSDKEMQAEILALRIEVARFRGYRSTTTTLPGP